MNISIWNLKIKSRIYNDTSNPKILYHSTAKFWRAIGQNVLINLVFSTAAAWTVVPAVI